jgi:hypothetical protein
LDFETHRSPTAKILATTVSTRKGILRLRFVKRAGLEELLHDVLVMESNMPFPIKICAICHDEFELKPDKPGFANRCPQCTEDADDSASAGGDDKRRMTADERRSASEANEARRQAMRNLLYRKDS